MITWLSNWHDDLIWCPSQLYRDYLHPNGEVWTLYVRWRWDDPWRVSTFDKDTENNWKSIGAGMRERDNINDVHKYAEDCLIAFLAREGFKLNETKQKPGK